MNEKPFPENLSNLLEAALPRPPEVKMDDQQIDCGICYAQYLPVGKINPIWYYGINLSIHSSDGLLVLMKMMNLDLWVEMALTIPVMVPTASELSIVYA